MVIIWQKSRMAYAGPCVIVQAVTLVKLCKAFGLLAQRARSARRDATDTFLQIPLQNHTGDQIVKTRDGTISPRTTLGDK